MLDIGSRKCFLVQNLCVGIHEHDAYAQPTVIVSLLSCFVLIFQKIWQIGI